MIHHLILLVLIVVILGVEVKIFINRRQGVKGQRDVTSILGPAYRLVCPSSGHAEIRGKRSQCV